MATLRRWHRLGREKIPACDYKLDVDSYASPYTQKVLYPLAANAYTSSGTTVGTQVGSLTTTTNVNLRKSASTKSVKKAVVPKTTLAYTKNHNGKRRHLVLRHLR